MRRRHHQIAFWSLAGILFVLHMDPWAGGDVAPVAFGWVPRDLGYHLIWIVCAAAMTFYLCARVWPDHE